MRAHRVFGGLMSLASLTGATTTPSCLDKCCYNQTLTVSSQDYSKLSLPLTHSRIVQQHPSRSSYRERLRAQKFRTQRHLHHRWSSWSQCCKRRSEQWRLPLHRRCNKPRRSWLDCFVPRLQPQ
ncbi:hypothetical protein BDV96DRAFT_563097 [Lophiotrema nucula]|uniref:Secreted protein n=1 Tax=Lophiotrema nucula TaxID=690887 RepID=A0A6A5ZT89_9PLEO|nr:hypothetical protein BDV96DRAFT_563097 [Lophiotrema nucula]